MSEFYLKCKQLKPNAKLPRRAFKSAGYDLWPVSNGTIFAGQSVTVPLGFAAEFTPGYVALICDRFSTGKQGLMRRAGVIDSDFRDEWEVILYNTGSMPIGYGSSKAIAQVLFFKVEEAPADWVNELSQTVRGKGAGGSSGH